MRNIKITLMTVLVLICFTLTLAVPCSASAAKKRVVDFAGLLSAEELSTLEAKLDSLSAELGHDIVIATTKSLEGKDLSGYSDYIYELYGYGTGDTHSGIMLLVCMSPRRYEISARGDAVKIVSEGDYDAIENAFQPLLSDGEYYDAFDAYAEQCEHVIKYDKRLSPMWIFVALAVGALVAFLVVRSMKAKLKSVRPQRAAHTYMQRETFRLDRSRDIYLYSHVTRVAKPKNNSSSGGRSSGGGARSGRSGSF